MVNSILAINLQYGFCLDEGKVEVSPLEYELLCIDSLIQTEN